MSSIVPLKNNCERSELFGACNGTDFLSLYTYIYIYNNYVSGRTSCRKCSKCFYIGGSKNPKGESKSREVVVSGGGAEMVFHVGTSLMLVEARN